MQNSDTRSSAQKQAALENANKHFICRDGATNGAKNIVNSALASSNANTLRLRTLRLAREASDKLALKST